MGRATVVPEEVTMNINAAPTITFRLCRTVCTGLLVALCLGAAARAADDAEEPEPLPLELRPYDVRVYVAFDNDLTFTADFRERVLAHLRDRCDGYWGRMCNVTIVEYDRLLPATAATLQRLPVGMDSPETADCDKAFFLTVQRRGGGYEVAGKCWDATTRTTSDVLTAETYRRGELDDRLFGLLSDLFEPIAEVTDFDFETARLNVRAGELLPGDPSQAQLTPGRLLTPLYRFWSREGEIRRIQEIPWTYLVVEDVDRSFVTCDIVSGLRVPLTTRRRRLIEALATGVRPRTNDTRLKLVSQRFPDQPMYGVTVSILPDRPEPSAEGDTPEAEKPKPVTLMADRQGTVTIAGDGSGLPVMLGVHSGKAMLARVPVVPGLVEETTIELPDDSIRLKVEGELAVLESAIIDAVAKRAVLVARTRAATKKNDWDEVDELLARIDSLTGPGALKTQLTIIREQAVAAAAARRDVGTQRRVESLCSKTSELIDHYLGPDKLREFREEVEELRKALQVQ